MMSKAELARKAGLSTLTIDRVEAGRPCRLDTKRKILLALGLKVSDKDRIFGGQLDGAETAVAAHDARHANPIATEAPVGGGSEGLSARTEPMDAASARPHGRDGNGEVTR